MRAKHWVHSVFHYFIFPRPLSLLELGVALVHHLAGCPRALIGAQSSDGEDTQEQPSLKSFISQHSPFIGYQSLIVCSAADRSDLMHHIITGVSVVKF